jgi:hypothetical protein
LTLQKAHARVHTSPRIITVACFLVQHSPIFGQAASSHTVFKFNSRNPMDAIDNDNINQSLKKQMERRLLSDRGFPIEKKYYPFVVDLLEPSSVKLDRETPK